MEKEVLNEQNVVQEVLELIRGNLNDKQLSERLSDYHENDIADTFEVLDRYEIKRLYRAIGAERFSDIFAYVEDKENYIEGMDINNLAKIISEMDSDDAVDVIEDIEDEETIEKLRSMLDEKVAADIALIESYDEDEIGSMMTTNYIVIHKNLTIRQAMAELVKQAGENDNISTIYVVDDDNKFYGAIDLKDLIIARQYADLKKLISTNYPTLNAHEIISECIERIKDYAEDSIPVLDDDNNLIGIITSQDIVEAVDEELAEDYAMFAGLTAEEDLNEKTLQSMRKRLPWLVVLLFLSMGVSSVVGVFEGVIAAVPVIICFQSLILGMAGNVGTQSLAVTIRVLMDEQLKSKDKLHLIFKEMRVGFANGVLLGTLAFVFLGFYITVFKQHDIVQAFFISGCVGIALMCAMVMSSLVGTLVPQIFHKLKIDPAVASGPLITTMNDLVAIITYYGFAWILLVKCLHM